MATSKPSPLSARPLRPDSLALPTPRRHPTRTILHRPLHPFILPNLSSEARDHAANERTFLSWLRLAVYLSVVSSAIVVSFHLRYEPSPLERRFALPLGIVFCLLSLGTLAMGLANYVRTIRHYAQRRALVQAGFRSQAVSCALVWMNLEATGDGQRVERKC